MPGVGLGCWAAPRAMRDFAPTPPPRRLQQTFACISKACTQRDPVMFQPPESSARTATVDTALVDTNAGDVPADRPHFKSWPRRLPRTLLLPETSLWANVVVTAARFPTKAATLYFGRSKTFGELK